MARYNVTLPIAGFAMVEVAAADEAEAIQVAMGEVMLKDIEEWDSYRVIVEGNVFRGPQNRAEAELIEEDDLEHLDGMLDDRSRES